MIKTFIDSNGQPRWVTLSSSSYRDRDVNPRTGKGEIVKLAAIKRWVATAQKAGDFGPLLWAHQDNKRIGTCDASAVAGAFLIETGTYDDTPIGRQALKYLESYNDAEFGPLGVSIGFIHHDKARRKGEYDEIAIVERSVLPLKVAANPYTAFAMQKSMKGQLMGNPLMEALQNFRGKVGEESEAVIAEAEKRTEALDDQGVERKSADAAEADAPEQDAPEQAEKASTGEAASIEAVVAAIDDRVREQVLKEITALFGGEGDEVAQKSLASAVEWRVADMLPQAVASAVSSEVYKQLNAAEGPLHDAMQTITQQVKDLMQSVIDEQSEVKKSIASLEFAPRAMQDAERRASKASVTKTLVNDDSLAEKFRPGESSIGIVKVDTLVE